MNVKDYLIVCVDDDLDVLNITGALIERLGYSKVKFSKVEDAVSYISKNQTKIMMIMSDLRMDDINGFGFKKILKEKNIDIPFIILTGYWTKEMSAEAMELRIDAFLEKPASAKVIDEYIVKFGLPRVEFLEDEREMIDGFVEESSPMLDEIESLILELEENPDSDQTLSVYFRLLHTIKGTASCVGLTNLGAYTHSYEDFIGELRTKTIPVNTKSTNVLLKGLDDLKEFFSHVEKHSNDSGIDFEKRLDKFKTENVEFGESSVEPEGQVDNSSKNKDEKAESETSASVEKVESKKEEDKMTVSMGILNDFMEESGELTVIRNTILKTVKKIESKYRGDKDLESLNELLEGMHSVTSNIQGKITEMRKVPLKNTFRPFKRLVRDLSKKLNKKVDLEITGEEVSVDNIVAKLYNNTLIHVVRNSLDHGLELPEDRLAAGKDEEGKIEFKVYEDGENIVLEIHDDGKGINPAFIRQKAIEKGLYSESELDNMSEIEIVNIIFASGFSTAEVVSDLSGRGVGMDMVRGSFEEMGGEIYVKSTYGEGSVFHLSVPIPKSILIINTLVVLASEKHYIFQMDDVSEVIRYEKELPHSKMFEVDGKKIINHNDEMIQLYSLSDALSLENGSKVNEVDNIVVLRVGQSKFGILVDEIHEFEEVVSRKLSDKIESFSLFEGASLLGSGEVAMIISSEGIANHIGISLDLTAKKTNFGIVESDNKQEVEEYMLFKYSDENYLSIPLEHVDRLETMHSSKFETTGNNVIINYLNRPLQIIDPAYLLGLKTENLLDQVNEGSDDVSVIVVNINNNTFGMVVAALDEIQESSDSMNADTITMPGLLGSIYIKDKTICVLDLSHINTMLGHKAPLIKLNEREELTGLEFDNIDNLVA
jgi:two-component system chemotaxis sensor kinase CheA